MDHTEKELPNALVFNLAGVGLLEPTIQAETPPARTRRPLLSGPGRRRRREWPESSVMAQLRGPLVKARGASAAQADSEGKEASVQFLPAGGHSESLLSARRCPRPPSPGRNRTRTRGGLAALGGRCSHSPPTCGRELRTQTVSVRPPRERWSLFRGSFV